APVRPLHRTDEGAPLKSSPIYRGGAPQGRRGRPQGQPRRGGGCASPWTPSPLRGTPPAGAGGDGKPSSVHTQGRHEAAPPGTGHTDTRETCRNAQTSRASSSSAPAPS